MATTNESTTISLINEIDSHMTIDIKDSGLLNQYNGVDITETKYYIKISNETYINKLLQERTWLLNNSTISKMKPHSIKEWKKQYCQLNNMKFDNSKSK